MLKITTQSGAEYLIDGNKAMRASGPFSPGINYMTHLDAVWEEYWDIPEPVVGACLFLPKGFRSSRLTTAVVSIEEV